MRKTDPRGLNHMCFVWPTCALDYYVQQVKGGGRERSTHSIALYPYGLEEYSTPVIQLSPQSYQTWLTYSLSPPWIGMIDTCLKSYCLCHTICVSVDLPHRCQQLVVVDEKCERSHSLPPHPYTVPEDFYYLPPPTRRWHLSTLPPPPCYINDQGVDWSAIESIVPSQQLCLRSINCLYINWPTQCIYGSQFTFLTSGISNL